MDWSQPSSSVRGILQAKEWVGIPFSRESTWPRDWAQISWIAGGFFTVWATREAPGVGDEGIKGNVKDYLELELREWEVSWKAWVSSRAGWSESIGWYPDPEFSRQGGCTQSAGAPTGPLWLSWGRSYVEHLGPFQLVYVGRACRGLVWPKLGGPGVFTWLDNGFESCLWGLRKGIEE